MDKQRHVFVYIIFHIFSNKAEPVFHTETAGGTGQKHTYITLLEDGYESVEQFETSAS